MTEIRIPYPETRRYPWELGTWDQLQMTRHLVRQQRQQGKRDSNPLRWEALERTIGAVEQLYAKGHRSFPGHKVKRLLVAAAAEVGWFRIKQPPKPRVRYSENRTEKECARCHEVKPMASFNAEATAAQKLIYGWNPERKRFVTSKLCAECRPKKAAQERRRVARSAKRKDKGVFLHIQYADDIARAKQAMRVARHRFRVQLDTPDGPVRYIHWPSDAAKEFYETRADMVALAEQRLEDHINDAVPLPEGGHWQELLSTEERDTLSRLHRNAFGTSRRKPPALY